jgi:hypothetical protein
MFSMTSLNVAVKNLYYTVISIFIFVHTNTLLLFWNSFIELIKSERDSWRSKENVENKYHFYSFTSMEIIVILLSCFIDYHFPLPVKHAFSVGLCILPLAILHDTFELEIYFWEAQLCPSQVTLSESFLFMASSSPLALRLLSSE